ncbi:lysozyme family protein [Mollicutes bacterium LVI A0078]|nr:lysozyme family protein [Mollicutes bacterium LVI A0075]WOO91310.1 lysozyme family protein [Mollicutes bacterium LVI A0078]
MIRQGAELYRKKVIYGAIASNALWILLLSFIFMFVVGVASEEDETVPICSDTVIPESVLAEEEVLSESMQKYNIDEQYTDLLLAQLYQESGGSESVLATDPWQSSESLCGYIGCITSPELSTNQAMSVHRDNIDRAIELGLEPTEELILQAYNFGGGYLTWLAFKGYEQTEEKAYEFSVYMTNQNPSYASTCNLDPEGKACYGDYKYASHVMEKYSGCKDGDSNIEVDENSLYVPYFDKEYTVTCDYGCYSGHTGVDLVSTTDDKIYAVGNGVVINVETNCAQSGYLGNTCGYGFGNHVVIKHTLNDVNLYSIYGHMSEVDVQVGDVTDANTYLGTEGASGNVTGAHLHLEFRYRTLSQSNNVNLYPLLARRERDNDEEV